MLTDAQAETFHRDGVLVVDDVLPPDILANLRAEYDTRLDGLIEGWGLRDTATHASFEDRLMAVHKGGHDWFQPLDISLPGDRIEADTPMHFGPAVFDMITAPRILDVVETLIGSEITSTPIQHVRIKPPERDLAKGEIRAHVGGTDWHQDRAVALAEADQTDMVTVWLAITDATIENGCLQAIPNEHALLPHCPKAQTAIADGFIDMSRAVPLPVKSGGAVLLHPMTPHAALPNRSDGIRWSFDLRFNRTGQPTGRSHFPDFIARSRINPERELRDWRTWREMWENARTELAANPHIDIHRWTHDAPGCA